LVHSEDQCCKQRQILAFAYSRSAISLQRGPSPITIQALADFISTATCEVACFFRVQKHGYLCLIFSIGMLCSPPDRSMSDVASDLWRAASRSIVRSARPPSWPFAALQASCRVRVSSLFIIEDRDF